MTEISASLLTLPKENAIHTLYNLETSKINYFHIDVMDGKFVPKNTAKEMYEFASTLKRKKGQKK